MVLQLWAEKNKGKGHQISCVTSM